MTLRWVNHLTFIIVNKIKRLEFIFSIALSSIVTFMSLFFIGHFTYNRSIAENSDRSS
jgi:hypothetical protein